MFSEKSVKVSREVEGRQSPEGNHIRRQGKAMDLREQAEMNARRGEKTRKERYPESQEGRTSKDIEAIITILYYIVQVDIISISLGEGGK